MARSDRTFLQGVGIVALLKILIALAGVLAVPWGPSGALPSRYALFLSITAIYATAAIVLISNARRDQRAYLLGLLYALIATAFADRLLFPLKVLGAGPYNVARAIFALQVDCFIPYVAWRFASAFPRVEDSFRVRRIIAMACTVTGVVGAVFMLLNVLRFLAATYLPSLDPRAGFAIVSRYNDAGLYWPLQFAMALPALPMMVVRSRRASRDEQRRTATLVWGLIVGSAPSLLWLLIASASRSFVAAFPIARAGWVIYPALLSIPFTTAYAVLIGRALDVSLVIRRAIRYLLARYTVTTIATVPLLLLALDLYRRRNLSVASIAQSREGGMLLACACAGIVTLVWRRDLLDAIDRRFFREQYDARQILGRLTEHCRWISDREELAAVLSREIDRALHVEAADVFLSDDRSQRLVGTALPLHSIDQNAPLIRLIARGMDPVEVDLARWDSPLAPISEGDREWLLRTGYRIFCALRAQDGDLVGMVALGPKRSELSFSSEDKLLLAGVSAAAEMTLAFHGLTDRTPPDQENGWHDDGAMPAAECLRCARVYRHGVDECEQCNSETIEAALPYVIAGKFRIDARLGHGAMGVVYRAVDLQLQRVVAIKTLPSLSPDRASRLRREARAMALFHHPNLALIYGVEEWRERPVLVVEYLAGGTLESRLSDGALGIDRVLEIGISLATALDAAHQRGLLHRDIKPSNIGFSSEGVPKLLDFGLARTVRATTHESILPASFTSRSDMPSLASRSNSSAEASGIVGTPLYMSPEALLAECPDPSFDIWSLCLVLYQCWIGHHPLEGMSLGEMRSQVVCEGIPIGERQSTTAEILAFFQSALGADLSRRPKTAAALQSRLRELREVTASNAHAGTSGSVSVDPLLPSAP